MKGQNSSQLREGNETLAAGSLSCKLCLPRIGDVVELNADSHSLADENAGMLTCISLVELDTCVMSYNKNLHRPKTR